MRTAAPPYLSASGSHVVVETAHADHFEEKHTLLADWTGEPPLPHRPHRPREEETSATIASIASRIMRMPNPLGRDGELYTKAAEIFGADGAHLDHIELLAVALDPLWNDVKRVAASALTQTPDHG